MYGQSAGNLQVMQTSNYNLTFQDYIRILRDYTFKLICQLVKNGNNYKLFKLVEYINYLAGLIEGDGCIVIPKTLRSKVYNLYDYKKNCLKNTDSNVIIIQKSKQSMNNSRTEFN